MELIYKIIGRVMGLSPPKDVGCVVYGVVHINRWDVAMLCHFFSLFLGMGWCQWHVLWGGYVTCSELCEQGYSGVSESLQPPPEHAVQRCVCYYFVVQIAVI